MSQDNPYIGPRTFQRNEGHLFFGREREARDLISLVASERLVVFYAQSGAGKSSIVNTRLIPNLEEKGYEVLPVGRVSGDSASGLDVDNIYVYNLIRSLEQHATDPAVLACLSLPEFLANLNYDDKGFFYDPSPVELLPAEDASAVARRALIVDQFEELFSTHPEAWEKREEFFQQLAQAVQDDPQLWVVLVMREDYIAALDPHAHHIPGGLRVRYYMQRLEREAALKAVKNPVQAIRPYADGVAEKLIDDLCSIKVQKPDGTLNVQPGQYVEPVQMQVVCYGLWENLPLEGTQITEKDLEDVGDVNQSLGKYFDRRVAEVAKAKNVRERLIREWFEEKLITVGGIRNMVLQEREPKPGELNDDVIQALQSDLVRAEKRGGATWYELTHDRLVEPILERNKIWFTENLSPLQRQAALWEDQDHNESWLLRDAALLEVEQWAKENQDELTDVEKEFLVACQKAQAEIEERQAAERHRLEMAQKLAEEQARSARRARIFNVISAVFVVIALVLAGISVSASRAADKAAMEAKANADAADAEAAKARVERARAEELSKVARSGQLSFLAQDKIASDLDLAILLGLEANGLNLNSQTEETLLTLMQRSNRYDGSMALREGIRDIEFSPDGQHFALLDANGFTIWRTASREQIGTETINRHSGPITALAISRDGTLMASGAPDGTLVMWHASQHAVMGEPLAAHSGGIRALVFSPEGNILASLSPEESRVRLWDLSDPAHPDPFEKSLQSESDMICIAFAPDGETLALGLGDGTIELWDVKTQRKIGVTEGGHEEAVFGLGFTNDGSTLVSGSYDDTVILWDVSDLEEPEMRGEPLEGHQIDIETIAISPDGKTAASGDDAGDIFLWDTQTGEMKGGPLNGHSTWVISLAFSPDNQTLAAGYIWDGMVTLWDVQNQAQIGSSFQAHRSSVWGIAFEQDGKTLISAGEDGQVKLWNVSNPKNPQETVSLAARHAGNVDSIRFSMDGSLLESYGSDGMLLFDAETGSPLGYGRTVDIPFESRFVAYELDGEGPIGDSLLIRDLETGEKTTLPLAGRNPHLSPDGNTLFYETTDPETGQEHINIWDIAQERVLRSFAGSFLGFNAAENIVIYQKRNEVGEVFIERWNRESNSHMKPLLLERALSEPLVSQDGSTLAYISSIDDNATNVQLNMLHTASDHPSVLDFNGGEIRGLSANGSYLLYMDYEETTGIPRTMVIDIKSNSPGTPKAAYLNRSEQSGAFLAYELYDYETGETITEVINTINGEEVLSEEGAFLSLVDSQALIVYQDENGINVFNGANKTSIGEPIPGEYLHISPDGRRLITRSANAITFWDLTKTWPLGQPLGSNIDSVSHAILSPDGTKLAAIGPQGVIILDPISGSVLGGPFKDHAVDLPGGNPAFSPDGSFLAVGSNNTQTTTLWNMETQEQIGAELPGSYPVFSPDGTALLLGSDFQATTIIWDLATREQQGQLPGQGATFSPDGALLAIGDANLNMTTIWHWKTKERQLQLPGFNIAFSRDSSLVAVGNPTTGKTIVWDTSQWTQKAAFEGAFPAFGDDRNILALGDERTGKTRIWKLDSQLYNEQLPGVYPLFSPDGNWLAVADYNTGTTTVAGSSTWEPEAELPGTEPTFGEKGELLAIGDYSTNTTMLWNLRTKEQLLQEGVPGSYGSLAAEDTLIAIGDSNMNRTVVLDLEGGAQSLDWKAAGTNVIFAPDGAMLASQNSDGFVIRDVESDQIVARLSSGEYAVEGLPEEYWAATFYAGHSKFAAIHSNLGTLVSWDIESGTSTIQGDPGQFIEYPPSPAFSPDGNYLVYGGKEALEIWDVVNGEPYTAAAQIARKDDINMISFSPDASLMALAAGKRILVYRFPELNEIVGDISVEETTMGLNFVMETDGTPRYFIWLDSNGNTQIWDWNRRTQLGETISGSIRFVGANTQDRSIIYIDPSGKLIRFPWDQDQQSWRDQLCPVVQRNFTQDEWALYFPGINYPEPENLTCPGYPSERQMFTGTDN